MKWGGLHSEACAGQNKAAAVCRKRSSNKTAGGALEALVLDPAVEMLMLRGNRAEYDTPGMQANVGIQVLIGAVCRAERLEAIDPVSYPMLMHALSSSSRSALRCT